MAKEITIINPGKTDHIHRLVEWIRQIIIANIESAGIIVEKITFLRALLMVLALTNIMIFTLYKEYITLSFVLWYAGAHFVFRQAFLFLSFTPKGIAYQLKKYAGEKTGYDLYEFFTGFSFFHRSYSYVLLVEFTAWEGLYFLREYKEILTVIAYTCTAIGLVINTWAFLLIKRETYYYLDMYKGRFLVEFKKEGPYEWVKNPMYSLGQLPSYGAALAVGSLPGLVLTLMNQVCCYIFYYSFELPHIKKLLAQNVLLAKTE